MNVATLFHSYLKCYRGLHAVLVSKGKPSTRRIDRSGQIGWLLSAGLEQKELITRSLSTSGQGQSTLSRKTKAIFLFGEGGFGFEYVKNRPIVQDSCVLI